MAENPGKGQSTAGFAPSERSRQIRLLRAGDRVTELGIAPIMYTFYMSWSFRALVFSAVFVWALVPQLTCFLPETTMTESEADCCKAMPADCGQANMPSSHVCCRQVFRSESAALSATRQITPPVESPATLATFKLPSLPVTTDWSGFSVRSFHAPPPDPQVSSLNLRI